MSGSSEEAVSGVIDGVLVLRDALSVQAELKEIGRSQKKRT